MLYKKIRAAFPKWKQRTTFEAESGLDYRDRRGGGNKWTNTRYVLEED